MARPHLEHRRLALLLSLVTCLAGCAGQAPGATPAPSTSGAPADVTILALGDSTVWDHDCGSDCSHSYPHLLEGMLAEQTGKRVALVDATQQNSLTAPVLLDEITSDSWGEETHDPQAPSPQLAIAAADVVIITLGANDVPWQQDEDPVCNGAWEQQSCIEQLVTPSIEALGRVIDAIHGIRGTRPTAIRVTTFYNELIAGGDYQPDRPPQSVEKGLTSAKVFSDALNQEICTTASTHGAVCIDLYHAMNGSDGTKALPANWFYWTGHPRGYDQTLTAEMIMESGFAPLKLDVP